MVLEVADNVGLRHKVRGGESLRDQENSCPGPLSRVISEDDKPWMFTVWKHICTWGTVSIKCIQWSKTVEYP